MVIMNMGGNLETRQHTLFGHNPLNLCESKYAHFGSSFTTVILIHASSSSIKLRQTDGCQIDKSVWYGGGGGGGQGGENGYFFLATTGVINQNNTHSCLFPAH